MMHFFGAKLYIKIIKLCINIIDTQIIRYHISG